MKGNIMFKVFIQRNQAAATTEIYFIEERGDGRRSIMLPVEMVFKTIEEGECFPGPSMRLYGSMEREFMAAFADALDKNGIKTDKDAKIEGTLEATRFHLDDLRMLLKLKK